MTLPLRILHIEDQQETRRVVETSFQIKPAYHIEYEGYPTVEEARQRLEVTYFHLLLLDLRLDDSNIQDRAGMDFLKWLYQNRLIMGQETYTPIYVAMLSSFGTIDTIREAMGQFDVIDFFDKDNVLNVKTLADLIYEELMDKLQINRNLKINWQFDHIDPARYLNQKGDLFHLESAYDEFIDLLAKLYSDREAITISLADDIEKTKTVFHLNVHYPHGDTTQCDDLFVELVDLTGQTKRSALLPLLPDDPDLRRKLSTTVHMRGLAFSTDDPDETPES